MACSLWTIRKPATEFWIAMHRETVGEDGRSVGTVLEVAATDHLRASPELAIVSGVPSDLRAIVAVLHISGAHHIVAAVVVVRAGIKLAEFPAIPTHERAVGAGFHFSAARLELRACPELAVVSGVPADLRAVAADLHQWGTSHRRRCHHCSGRDQTRRISNHSGPRGSRRGRFSFLGCTVGTPGTPRIRNCCRDPGRPPSHRHRFLRRRRTI